MSRLAAPEQIIGLIALFVRHQELFGKGLFS